jgi:hypothetical protein
MLLNYLLEFLYRVCVRRLRAWRRHKLVVRVQQWPQAAGNGLEGHADCSEDSTYAICSAEINYTYLVDGALFAGSVSLPADNKRHAEGIALGWRNREILVRYSPGDPTQSTLLLEDQRMPSRAIQTNKSQTLRSSLVINRELEPRIRREQLRHLL